MLLLMVECSLLHHVRLMRLVGITLLESRAHAVEVRGPGLMLCCSCLAVPASSDSGWGHKQQASSDAAVWR